MQIARLPPGSISEIIQIRNMSTPKYLMVDIPHDDGELVTHYVVAIH